MQLTLFGKKMPISAFLGLVVIVVFIGIAIFAPWIAPYQEAETIGSTWDSPSAAALLGTDQIGRDMLTRLMYGARMTLGLAVAITVLSFVIGILTGLVSAVAGGYVDMLFTRLVDVMMSIPGLIFALIILGVFGSSLFTLVITVAVIDSLRVFRLSRSLGQNLTVLEFVEAAKLRGEGLWWVVTREILPNAWAPLVSEFGLRFCFNFLFIAALSFLGLGIQPPNADWGSMVKENSLAISLGGYAPLYPAGAIALLTVAVNRVVDWLLSIDARPSGAQAQL